MLRENVPVMFTIHFAVSALASPSLIALSSKDPILTAFELSWELRRLSFAEHEFKSGTCSGFRHVSVD